METALFAVIIAPFVNITGKMQITKNFSKYKKFIIPLHALEKILNEK